VTGPHIEEGFEAELLAAGWARGSRDGYRSDLGLDTGELMTFLGAIAAESGDGPVWVRW
jgi:hypothetical protein